MKHLKYTIVAFAVALLAASCSRDELPGEGGDTPATGQMQAYTFTVSPDIVMEGDAKTRSEGTEEEKPTRCFMQVFDNYVPVNASPIKGMKEGDSYTFTVTLASDKSYDYCFYADNDNYMITNLLNITWPNTGNVVAYAHKLSGKPEEEMSVTLTHIVTKITLKHIGDSFTVEAGEEFKISYPCADAYNVLDDAASTGNGYEDFTYTFTEETTINDGDEVCSFYTIVPYQQVENYPDITLTYRWRHLTIEGVTLEQNAHVVLQGDLSPDNEKWDGSALEKAKYYFMENETTPKGEDIVQNYFTITQDELSQICLDITGQNLQDISFHFNSTDSIDFAFNPNLNGCIVTLTIGDKDYIFVCHYDTSLGYPSLLP